MGEADKKISSKLLALVWCDSEGLKVSTTNRKFLLHGAVERKLQNKNKCEEIVLICPAV